MKVTEQVLRIAAKSFFSDAEGDEDYPHLTWNDQYKEFKTLLDAGNISEQFLLDIYEWNKGRFSEENEAN